MSNEKEAREIAEKLDTNYSSGWTEIWRDDVVDILYDGALEALNRKDEQLKKKDEEIERLKVLATAVIVTGQNPELLEVV